VYPRRIASSRMLLVSSTVRTAPFARAASALKAFQEAVEGLGIAPKNCIEASARSSGASCGDGIAEEYPTGCGDSGCDTCRQSQYPDTTANRGGSPQLGAGRLAPRQGVCTNYSDHGSASAHDAEHCE
jgi:hypothetical protein